MTLLYVSSDGATVRKDGGRLRVERDGETLQTVPLGRVDEAVVFDSVQVTTQALVALLRQGARLAILSHGGELLGRVEPPLGRNGELRVLQCRRLQDPVFALNLARVAVSAKLENSRQVLLRRIHDNPVADAADRTAAESLGRAAETAALARDADALRGVEGAAARQYWAAFARQLSPGTPAFTGRRYRPAPDPVNAALSLGYSLLTARVSAALEAVGLDPACGFFHGMRYGRPSLALDVLEPLRAPVMDRFVLRMFNLRRVGADDYEPAAGGGVRLRQPSRSAFLRAWDEWAREHDLAGAILRQAEGIRACLEGDEGAWQPYRWRARP